MKRTKGKLKKGKARTSVTGAPSPPPPVSPTTAYTLFEGSIQRAKNLIEIHRMAHGSQARPPVYLADAHRAAIVLAVSALDAFVRAFVIDHVVAMVSDVKKSMPDRLIKQVKDCLSHESVIEAARQSDLSSRIEKAFRERFEDQSFQGVKKITEAMQMLGFDDVFSTIAGAARVNEDGLKRDLGKFTKRRHEIAHCSDFDLTQTPPVENRIRKEDVLECIRTVELVAKHINNLR